VCLLKMVMTYSNWLSPSVWISEVIGSATLFLLLGLVLINYLCVKNNIDSKTTIILNLLGALGFSTLFYSQSVLVIVVSVLPFLIYGVYAAFWK